MRLFLAWMLLLSCCLPTPSVVAQAYLQQPKPEAIRWADSVLQTLTPEQRIAQLMVLRLSGLDAKTRKPVYYEKEVSKLIQSFSVGGVCLFQGHPYATAQVLNRLQAQSKVPLLVCVDGEWGLGMRLYDSVMPLPKQMMLGAMQDTQLLAEYATRVAQQCRRLGIHVNYAPVMDINNNPANPVINDRSFGERRDLVARYGLIYIRGLEAAGIMSCAKHFPGHGDVSVDSHYDLPLIRKTRAQLDSLELFPFREAIAAGVGSIMIAHLFIPELDATPNQATSLSPKAIQQLLRNELGYQGITFTDALEMQGVKKFYPSGAAAVQSLIAGNDMLCLPEEVPAAIQQIKQAIKKKKGLTWADIDERCRRVLLAKYHYIGPSATPIETYNITANLNEGLANLRQRIAEKSLTVLNLNDTQWTALPQLTKSKKLAYVALGLSTDNALTRALRESQQADIYFFNYRQDGGRLPSLLALLEKKYQRVITGVHNLSRSPATQFGLSPTAIKLAKGIGELPASMLLLFGNPYALTNFDNYTSTLVAYDDDTLTQKAVYRWLQGEFHAEGRLPVSAGQRFAAGSGEDYTLAHQLQEVSPPQVGMDPTRLQAIDSIVQEALLTQASPGCVVLAARNGRIFWHKAYGYLDETRTQPTTIDTRYDLASITKIAATTLAIMKLNEQNKIKLLDSVGTYLPEARGTAVSSRTLEQLLLHEAGLPPFIRFHDAYLDHTGKPNPNVFLTQPAPGYVQVTPQLFLPSHYIDSIFKRIYNTPLGSLGKYVYSDLDFLLLGRVIERVTGSSLDTWVTQNIYQPLGIRQLSFNPTTKTNLAPTEREKDYRQTLLHGTVHDPTAALLGGVAGHAGLFGTAKDLAILMQLLLNNGQYNGKQLLTPETIQQFTSYGSLTSRRGLGFDKPERDNAQRSEPYPCLSASPETFGHTGFTGTCAWADPQTGILFIFLSNRVHPNGGNQKQLLQANIRPRIHEVLYQARQQ